ncbi:hypothetical protein PHSC3_001841 [Chlamydiales bacterium STE3]|nr:hypothetical protein PHSC3_001841 [Chlamydiales bacterium STE3]
MNSFIEMYRYNNISYTGTLLQPDTLSLFIKKDKDKDFLVCNAEPTANIIGKSVPIVGSFTGIARIVNSVKSIFQNLSKSNASEPNALWNSFKNLFRGITEVCPFSGIFLIIFDSVRNSISIHSHIIQEIQKQENIAGIAIDGKVIFTIDLTQLENSIKTKPTSDKHRLAIFKELSLEFLKRQEQSGCSLKMTEIFPKLKEAIEKKKNK